MAINRQKFQKAVDQLARYHGIVNEKDVDQLLKLNNIEGKKLKSNNNTTITLPSKLDLEINKLLMDDYAGALKIGTLYEKLTELARPDLHDDLVPTSPEENKIRSELVRIYRGNVILNCLSLPDGQSTSINSCVNKPSKEKPNLSVIKVNSPIVGPEKRFTDAATIFLNGMPTLEMSRATPYLEIEFLFPRAPINDQNIIQTMSLPKFLYGAKKVTNGSPLYAMMDSLKVSATDLKKPKEQKPDIFSNIGMEIFTSPQLLVNTDTTSENRANPVLNKFAPFLTLKKLDLNVVPSTGIMSYKSGQLSLVLHDRSRLNEIAEFLKPDLYGTTELSIEYGWVHPDGELIVDSNNVYGNFINGIRVKERYAIINSSFTFEEGGIVSINLSIAMKGSADFDLIQCSDSTDKLSEPLKQLDEIQKAVQQYKDSVVKNVDQEKVKEIRGIQILDAAMDARNHLTLSDDLKKSLNEFIASANKSNNPDAKNMANTLTKMFGTTKKQKDKGISLTGNIKSTIQDIVKDKIDRLTNGSDPFTSLKTTELKDFKKNPIKRGTVNFNNKKSAFKPKYKGAVPLNGAVTLAKLLLFFIGEPLASTGRYDDIQLIFHTFNSHAGKVRDKNIAEFPIDLAYFVEQYYRLRESTVSKSSNLSIKQFLNFLTETILDDYAAPAYGLVNTDGSSLYKRKEDGSAEAADEVPVYQEKMEKALKNYGITDGIFVPGKIHFMIEAFPERNGIEEGDDNQAKSGANILKIHVIDQANSSYETLGKIISAQRDAELSVFNASQSPNNSGDSTPANDAKRIEASRLLAIAESSNLIQQIVDKDTGDTQLYKIVGGQKDLKEYLMKTMPYVIYGAAGTTIKAANLSSMQEPQLSTINLMRSHQKSELDPSGQHPAGLPMQIIPTQLTLQTLGMPLINFAQSFFIDFQTGTTADNIYAVVGLTHSFEPGSFTTEIKMSPLDVYGRYIGIANRLAEALVVLKDVDKNKNQQ